MRTFPNPPEHFGPHRGSFANIGATAADNAMTDVTYEVVEHNGGWAYKLGDVFSETFATHDEAVEAAERAAQGHMLSGPDESIEYEDERGVWHEETVSGQDRPQADVEE